MKNNRAAFLLFAVLSTSLFYACSSSDDDGPSLATIVGFWSYDSHEIEARVNDKDFVTFLIEELGMNEVQAQFYQSLLIASYVSTEDLQSTTLEFNEDGTYEVSDGTDTETGTYELKDNSSILLMHSEDSMLEFHVEELSQNRLSLAFSEEEQIDLTEDGTEEAVHLLISLKLKK
jgi:hypothetical protein